MLEILKGLVELREKLRPYVEKHMVIASETGAPVMRPMFFDYPEDEECYRTGEQYMFGDDILFAPVVKQGQTEKEVYLPDGKWIFASNGQVFEGGTRYSVKAEIDETVVFVKYGAEVMEIFEI